MADRTIKSPLPGTFYRRPSPEADAFVSEGDTVKPGDVIGLVEIMKSFHEVHARRGRRAAALPRRERGRSSTPARTSPSSSD